MEPINKIPGTVKATEVLFFEEAEVSKVRGNQTSYATFGPLSLIFVKDYGRFFFQLNDWRYPLMRRLNISASVGQDSMRTYTLPTRSGSFILKITKGTSQALDNLETILYNNSHFSINGKVLPPIQLESSPDDKVVRRVLKDTGLKEVVTQTVKQAIIHKAQIKVATLKTGTKYLVSTKRRIDPTKIKNKDFKKEVKSRIKKDFFQSSEKLSSDFLQKRKENANMNQVKEYSGLIKIVDAPTFYVPQEDLEDAILDNKEFLSQTAPTDTDKTGEKKGLLSNLKEGLHNVKQTVTNLIGRDRNAGPNVQSENVSTSTEGLTHYQG